MSCDLESVWDGWDRTFLNVSAQLSEPFCSAWHLFRYRLVAPLDPQKFENYTTVSQEVAMRVILGLSAVLGSILTCIFSPIILTLGLARMVFRSIGFALQEGGYTHIRGTFPEKILNPFDPQLKVMSWNICGIAGGLSLDHGGVIHWRSRLDRIVEKIGEENPDVLILQEIYDVDLAERLLQELQAEFAHIYMHLGPNVFGMVGGCMVFSKCVVHHFSHTSFSNNSWDLNRGFASLEIKSTSHDVLPCARIIGTHFIHGDPEQAQQSRVEQMAQIVDHVAHQTLAMPTILAGDLNTERDQLEGMYLSSHLHHAYAALEPTSTNRLTAQWDMQERTVWDETIDYISLFKSVLPNGDRIATIDTGVVMEDCHLVRAFDASYNTKTALSDHHGLSVIIRGLCQAINWK